MLSEAHIDSETEVGALRRHIYSTSSAAERVRQKWGEIELL